MDIEKLVHRAQVWLQEDPDPTTRRELEEILEREDHAALADRFGAQLEFGTAGLRGLLGAGPNRFNRAVVIRTTAGMASYLLEAVSDVKERGIVVGYDGRHLSAASVRDVAAVFAGYGIPARVFRDFAPTPLTAFAIPHLGAAAGVMITASHNPADYNGYKAYWSNGAQIIPPHDAGIAASIEKIGSLPDIPRREEEEARAAGLFLDVGDETVDAYLDAIASLSLPGGDRSAVRVAYTAMHGVGGALACRALERFGFEQVEVVEAQQEPDPDFPTVKFPNPEEEGAMDLVLDLARARGSTLVLANDPDADRLAVAVPLEGGGYRAFSGNEVGVLLMDYLLSSDPRGGERLVISTIVSTPMAKAIAQGHDVRYEEVLTGFKWIANKAMELEAKTGTRFVMGFEEALGYSVGSICRDKDGISAAAVVAELAAHAAAQRESLLDRLERLYRTYGLYLSTQEGFTAPGATGSERIQQTMAGLRAAPPTRIGSYDVLATRDYQAQTLRRQDGSSERLDLPRSNVLAFDLIGGSRVIARPSGTEPKIKYYFDLREPVREGEPLEVARTRAKASIQELARAFVAITEREN